MVAGSPGMVDLLVVGGGINGTGVACDAAGRGLSVALVEQDDLASATSSASSKLVHGGLRYLEHCQFRLVRESLGERETLMAKAPHIVRPLRMVLPHAHAGRPAWLVRLGLFLYDHLAARVSLPGSRGLDLAADPAGAPLRPEVRKGFEYHDCVVDDARLVVLNAMQAAGRGARVMTRTRLVAAERGADAWQARLSDLRTGAEFTLAARALVNVGGPWAQTIAENVLGRRAGRRLSLIKGSHVVVPRLYDGSQAYILQNTDGRVVFVVPFERDFSLIGTTEVPVSKGQAAACDAAEVTYLADAVGRYFSRPFRPDEVVWSYAGVRPLFAGDDRNPSAITRDYVLDVDLAPGRAPAVNVYGGKITTYRRLAETVLDRLKPAFPAMGRPWTATATLPGGEVGPGGLAEFTATLAAERPGFEAAWLADLARRHGSLARDVLGDARGPGDLGRHFGAGLYAREVDYLIDREWAETAADVLWRRTKAGLHMGAGERDQVAAYIAGRGAPIHAAS